MDGVAVMHVSSKCAAEGCVDSKTCGETWLVKMIDPDVESAYNKLAMHHSETLLYVQELQKQLRTQSVIAILKERVRYWVMGARYE